MTLGTGKPLLFLHGITNSGRAWAAQLPFFVAAGYQVIIPDLPGHGSSSLLQAPTTPRDIAASMIALLRDLGVEKADCVGLSLGGTIAIEAALAAPDLFDRLIIANSFLRANTPELAKMAAGWKETFAKPYGPLMRLEATWPLLVSQGFRDSEEGLRTYQVWHAQTALADGVSYGHIADGFIRYDASKTSATLRNPVLIMVSTGDRISPMANAEALSAAIANSQLVALEGSEHISNVDCADMFNQIVFDFLRQPQATSRAS